MANRFCYHATKRTFNELLRFSDDLHLNMFYEERDSNNYERYGRCGCVDMDPEYGFN